MLLVDKHILSKISETFLKQDVEQGFLLGSSLDFNHIDSCFELPASDAGLHYYEPNSLAADKAIRHWGHQGICFCGMIHSHVVNKRVLSENDIAFAKALYTAYHLPVLWFGIGIVNSGEVTFQIYSVTEIDEQICISPETYETTDDN